MNNHLQADTLIKDGKTAHFNVILDRLSVCFDDSNAENVKATYGLLIVTKSPSPLRG